MTAKEITLNVNGRVMSITVEPRQTLAVALREQLGLTGTHLGCEHGVCGACTILLDGEAVRGCLIFAVQAAGHSVTTIEGVSAGAKLTRIQEAMHQHHALQCGFCTPGMVLALESLFATIPNPGEGEVRDAISGNLCRCTGYQPIVEAALSVAAENRSIRSGKQR